jgi:hypothetical protein
MLRHLQLWGVKIGAMPDKSGIIKPIAPDNSEMPTKRTISNEKSFAHGSWDSSFFLDSVDFTAGT